MTEAVRDTGVESPHSKKRSLAFLLGKYGPLWPTILGLVFARCGIIVGSYGSYASTDQGFFTDGATLLSMAILAIPLAIIGFGNVYLVKRRIHQIVVIAVFLQFVSLVAYAVVNLYQIDSIVVRYAISVLNQVSGISAICFWLVRARGASSGTAALFVFGALGISEVFLYVVLILPQMVGVILCAVGVVAQYPLMRAARHRTLPMDIKSRTLAGGWLGQFGSNITDIRFLIVTGLGIGLMSIAIGLLRGFPDGQAIAFSPLTRTLNAVLTIALCGYLYLQVRRGKDDTLTVAVWVIMQSLAVEALFAYSLAPDQLQYGAIFTTTANAMMVGFTWFIMISFMSKGWRHPYYYCLGGFMVFLVPRALGRMVLMTPSGIALPDITVTCVIGILVLLSAQFVFIQYMKVLQQRTEILSERITNLMDMQVEQGLRSVEEGTHQASSEEAPLQRKSDGGSRLVRLMGLDERDAPEGGLTGLRQITMQESVEQMGEQFLLSEREIEVLTLYALGHTQKHVAEELFISPGTVHAHMKRIYTKTGLHSRQEILDYLQQYTN